MSHLPDRSKAPEFRNYTSTILASKYTHTTTVAYVVHKAPSHADKPLANIFSYQVARRYRGDNIPRARLMDIVRVLPLDTHTHAYCIRVACRFALGRSCAVLWERERESDVMRGRMWMGMWPVSFMGMR